MTGPTAAFKLGSSRPFPHRVDLRLLGAHPGSSNCRAAEACMNHMPRVFHTSHAPLLSPALPFQSANALPHTPFPTPPVPGRLPGLLSRLRSPSSLCPSPPHTSVLLLSMLWTHPEFTEPPHPWDFCFVFENLGCSRQEVGPVICKFLGPPPDLIAACKTGLS